MESYLKPASIIPTNDKSRLEKLYAYQILDTPAEEAFDSIARLAAQIFDTPGAFVSLVDQDRVFFKSSLAGFNHNEVERKDSLCSLAILRDQVTVFHDTLQFAGLSESPFVSAPGGIRFYAGAPLRTREGYNLGTVCVIDSVPRQATEKQLQMLQTLAGIVVDKLEFRLLARRAISTQQDFMNMIVHDLKNPVSSIMLAAETILLDAQDENAVREMAGFVKSGVQSVSRKLDELLQQHHSDHPDFQIRQEEIEICGLIDKVIANFNLQLQQKKQKVICSYTAPVYSKVDRKRMQEIFENLLSNAIKYSPNETTIRIKVIKQEDQITISFQDEGLGMDGEDIKKLFSKYATMSAKPTGKESSHGLGLSIVKILVELHKGTIRGESPGIGKGSTFTINLPN